MKLQDFQINHQHYIMKKAKPTLKNITAYIQGNLRYKLYYNKFAFLIPIHIREQIDARINSMDKQCYLEGQCKMCGCSTTALQMCDKQCDKPCYPPMVNKVAWEKFKSFKYFPFGDQWWKVKIIDDKLYYFNSATNIELFKEEEGIPESERVLQSTDLNNHREFR